MLPRSKADYAIPSHVQVPRALAKLPDNGVARAAGCAADDDPGAGVESQRLLLRPGVSETADATGVSSQLAADPATGVALGMATLGVAATVDAEATTGVSSQRLRLLGAEDEVVGSSHRFLVMNLQIPSLLPPK